MIRSFGMLNEKAMIANRSFFLIDLQGVLRKKWIVENSATTVVYSPTLLKDIEEIIGKR